MESSVRLSHHLLYQSLLIVILYCSESTSCPADCVCLSSFDATRDAENFIVSCVNPSVITEGWLSRVIPIKELYLSDMNIHSLDHKAFKGVKSIDILHIRFSRIGILDQHVFKDITGQTSKSVITLMYNEIEEIANHAFHRLAGFASVQIIGGAIRFIHPGAFTDIETGSVIISGVRIDTLESEAFGSSVRFKPDYSLESSLDAVPIETKERLPHSYSFEFAGCDGKSIEGATASFFSLISNNVSIISSKAFSGITGATVVNLHDNHIGLMEGNIFRGSENILIVIATDNVIEGLASRAFAPLRDSEKVIITGNQVECAAPDALEGIQAIETLRENNLIVLGSKEDNRTNCRRALQQESSCAKLASDTAFLFSLLCLSTCMLNN